MKIRLFLFVLVLNSFAIAQNTSRIDQILDKSRKQIDKFEAKNSETAYLISSEFANDIIVSHMSDLSELTVVKIYYVYTKYKQSEQFDQLALDRKRFNQLAELMPELVKDRNIQWEIIEQTGCINYTQGNMFFHGFVLIHRPILSAEKRAEEIRLLMEYVNNPNLDIVEPNLDPFQTLFPTSEIEGPTRLTLSQKARFKDGEKALYEYLQRNVFPAEISQRRGDQWVKFSFKVDKFGRIGQLEFNDSTPSYMSDKISEVFVTMPEWLPAEIEGATVESTINMELRVSYSRSVNGMYTIDKKRPSFMETDNGRIAEVIEERENREQQAFKGSTIYRGMRTIDKSEKVAIVMDVTGSMYPHIAALKRWLDSNPDSLVVTSYSFFNDGDGKRTSQKKKGETGGIYLTKEKTKVIETIEQAMLGGTGGETSESDMEAILNALKNDSLCDAILLIGDNFSDIRDISLLEDVTKKVNVLICAAPETIRAEYLDVCYKTGGYLIMDGKKYTFNELKRGDLITVNGYKYKFNGKVFEQEE